MPIGGQSTGGASDEGGVADILVASELLSRRLPRILDARRGSGGLIPSPPAAVRFELEPNELSDSVPRLPFGTDHFAVVHVYGLLEACPEVAAASVLAEMQRVLHPDGVLYLVLPANFGAPIAALRNLGFDVITTSSPAAHRTRADSLALILPSDSVVVTARRPFQPHAHDSPFGTRTFRARVESVVRSAGFAPRDVSYVIPVRNESPRLPYFLSFLEVCTNVLGSNREFIFVTNGCTDDSDVVIDCYLAETSLAAHRVSSEPGILPAILAGTRCRSLDGLIGKLDADTILHPQVLDLLESHLLSDDRLQVVYGEPTAVDAQGPFNEADHVPAVLSKRLYFTAKASLLREDFLSRSELAQVRRGVCAEDIFLSFYLAFYYGLESISRAPGALVYSKTVGTFEDVVRQQSRSASDITRLMAAFPPFGMLQEVFEQQVRSVEYAALLQQANASAGYVDEWTRIPSTK